jgi:hypothetical protein
MLFIGIAVFPVPMYFVFSDLTNRESSRYFDAGRTGPGVRALLFSIGQTFKIDSKKPNLYT